MPAERDQQDPPKSGIAMQLLRWLAVPVSAGALVVGCFVAARAFVAAADERCLPEHMVGGTCVAPWHTDLVEIVIYVGIIIVALGMATLPAIIAPRFQRAVSIVGWLLTSGLVAAAFITTGWVDLRLPLAVAVSTGALGVLWIWKRSGRLHHVAH